MAFFRFVNTNTVFLQRLHALDASIAKTCDNNQQEKETKEEYVSNQEFNCSGGPELRVPKLSRASHHKPALYR